MSQRDPQPKGRGVPSEVYRSICLEGGVAHSNLDVVNLFRVLAGKPLIQMMNRKLD